jgi:hypothetical protein
VTRSQKAAILASLILLLEDCSYGPYVYVDAALADAALNGLHAAHAASED